MTPNRPACEHYVRVTAQVEGLHQWYAAPEQENYLRHPHRHLFVVTVRMQVRHDDREAEINAFARWLHNEALPALANAPRTGTRPLDFGPQSCEQLAERVTNSIRAKFGPGRWIECEVLEDGILGGGVRCLA